jgi:glycosyltransferase involved in cell wall biosynthesis
LRATTQTAHAILTERVDLTVVIPAYNEGTRIERALERVTGYLRARGGSWEIVVVDDGSSDQTALIVQRFVAAHADTVRLEQLRSNRGKGAALRAGVAVSRGARVLLMDADLATPIEELDELERACAAGADVATGSRAVATSHIKRYQSPLRVLLGRVGNLWIQTLAVPGIHDTQCGFKLFDGDAARRVFAACREERFGIDIEALCLARRRYGLRVVEVGVAWEHQDGSKVRWRDYVDVFVKVPRIAWSVLLHRAPPRT